MRKLKLQVQITVDGFVAGPNGELDWMTNINEDKPLHRYITDLVDTSDTILLGRKMTEGFVNYWEGVVAHPESPEFTFAERMVNMSKVVFSRTAQHIDGKNVRVENGPLVEAVNRLKAQPGKDIIVYGGATFVSALIENGLIDELHLFVNQVALGSGLRIFSGRTSLAFIRSTTFDSGVVINTYRPYA